MMTMILGLWKEESQDRIGWGSPPLLLFMLLDVLFLILLVGKDRVDAYTVSARN